MGLAVAILSAPLAAAETLTLSGVMTGRDHQTYREVPFRTPPGTTSISVDFEYTGKDQKSVIDVGVRDPQRFRGWSGGNKRSFTLTETWATPSYLPGPLPAGQWKLILGVPNLRRDARAEFTARVTLGRDPVFHGFADAPLNGAAGWYRGDLHLHTGHSDGSCAAQSGAKAPCPVFRTLEAATARGLDFVAITDHNTTSHFQALAELQPHYDRLLLIPGREVTTFQGHANVLGATAPLDFQLGGPRAPSFDHIVRQADATGALVSINPPGLPSGEACMGCGFTAPANLARVPLVEVVNGAVVEGPLAGRAFWERSLDAGLRVTGVAGSDNHDALLDPAKAQAVGKPTTVVRAASLSHDAILSALRAGHAFIDVQGARDRRLEMTARTASATAAMGDTLVVGAGEDVKLEVRVTAAPGGRIEFRGDPKLPVLQPLRVPEGETPAAAVIRGDGAAHWVRADVRGPDGALWLIGNPIYLRPR